MTPAVGQDDPISHHDRSQNSSTDRKYNIYNSISAARGTEVDEPLRYFKSQNFHQTHAPPIQGTDPDSQKRNQINFFENRKPSAYGSRKDSDAPTARSMLFANEIGIPVVPRLDATKKKKKKEPQT